MQRLDAAARSVNHPTLGSKPTWPVSMLPRGRFDITDRQCQLAGFLNLRKMCSSAPPEKFHQLR